eukprot:SAG31_NODE_3199_length_4564_cov_18.467861_6_plen_130_part_00
MNGRHERVIRAGDEGRGRRTSSKDFDADDEEEQEEDDDENGGGGRAKKSSDSSETNYCVEQSRDGWTERRLDTSSAAAGPRLMGTVRRLERSTSASTSTAVSKRKLFRSDDSSCSSANLVPAPPERQVH